MYMYNTKVILIIRNSSCPQIFSKITPLVVRFEIFISCRQVTHGNKLVQKLVYWRAFTGIIENKITIVIIAPRFNLTFRQDLIITFITVVIS